MGADTAWEKRQDIHVKILCPQGDSPPGYKMCLWSQAPHAHNEPPWKDRGLSPTHWPGTPAFSMAGPDHSCIFLASSW